MSNKNIEKFSEKKICYDEQKNEIHCNINYTEKEWQNDLLFSKNYCHNDCNGIMNMIDGSIEKCDTKKLNNLDEYKKRLIDSPLDMIKCNKSQTNIPKKELTLYEENENLLNGYLESSLKSYKNNNLIESPAPENFTNHNSDNFKYINKTIKNIISLSDKTSDSVKSATELESLEHFTNTA